MSIWLSALKMKCCMNLSSLRHTALYRKRANLSLHFWYVCFSSVASCRGSFVFSNHFACCFCSAVVGQVMRMQCRVAHRTGNKKWKPNQSDHLTMCSQVHGREPLHTKRLPLAWRAYNATQKCLPFCNRTSLECYMCAESFWKLFHWCLAIHEHTLE